MTAYTQDCTEILNLTDSLATNPITLIETLSLSDTEEPVIEIINYGSVTTIRSPVLGNIMLALKGKSPDVVISAFYDTANSLYVIIIKHT